MKHLFISASLILPTAASAHPGHLADVAGHGHWVAGAAIATAIAVGIWGALKGKNKDETSNEAEAAAEEATDEALEA